MIVLYHEHNKVKSVFDAKTESVVSFNDEPIARVLMNLVSSFDNRILVWCHESQKNNINFEVLKKAFHLKNMMMSFSLSSFLPESIGYVEDTPFINVNKNVKYPTWMMSSDVGAIYSSKLLKFKDEIKQSNNFDYFLNSIAKLGMSSGLLCYSNPKLLKDSSLILLENKASKTTLFKFVKQHYKTRWLFLLVLNFIIYDRQYLFIPFLKSLFYKKKSFLGSFSIEVINNSKKVDIEKTIDVIIPTIGRKKYLYDVLKDLSNQTLLPKQVIIVEQNSEENSKSELSYITSETWPFNISHSFINQTGSCNARNLALKNIQSEFVFFADDDIRFDNTTLAEAINTIVINNFNAITLSCLQAGEAELNNDIVQWNSFGSGCSITTSKVLNELRFDLGFEHGFGEDTDFGMQLRNEGVDVLYAPQINLQHIKAPIGGFRKSVNHLWNNSKIKCKPSPTIMLFRLKHNSKKQLQGYKTVLFLKYYKSQAIYNPIVYLKIFKKQWKQSVFWANKLKK